MPLGKRSLLTWDDEGRGKMQSTNDHLQPFFWNIVRTTIFNPIFGILKSNVENIVSTHHVCVAGTQGNVGARPMGSGVQWARGGVLMRVRANTKYTNIIFI